MNYSYMAIPGLPGSTIKLSAAMRCERIIQDVCKYFNITEDILRSRSRKTEIVTPRMICTHLLKKVGGMRLQPISDYFNQDHSTACNSIKTITDLLEVDELVKRDYGNILARL